MGYAVYQLADGRWAGYGVPAECDHPKCHEEIDRGLGFVCGDEVGGGDHGCGLYFCSEHRRIGAGFVDQCTRCFHRKPPYPKKPDAIEWVKHQLTDDSWAEWRRANGELVLGMYARIFFDAVHM